MKKWLALSKIKLQKRGLTKYVEIKQFIKHLDDEEILDNIPKSTQSFVCKLKIFACVQLSKRCHTEKEYTNNFLTYNNNLSVRFKI